MPHPHCIDPLRRRLLGGAALAATLAACGGGSDATTGGDVNASQVAGYRLGRSPLPYPAYDPPPDLDELTQLGSAGYRWLGHLLARHADRQRYPFDIDGNVFMRPAAAAPLEYRLDDDLGTDRASFLARLNALGGQGWLLLRQQCTGDACANGGIPRAAIFLREQAQGNTYRYDAAVLPPWDQGTPMDFVNLLNAQGARGFRHQGAVPVGINLMGAHEVVQLFVQDSAHAATYRYQEFGFGRLDASLSLLGTSGGLIRGRGGPSSFGTTLVEFSSAQTRPIDYAVEPVALEQPTLEPLIARANERARDDWLLVGTSSEHGGAVLTPTAAIFARGSVEAARPTSGPLR